MFIASPFKQSRHNSSRHPRPHSCPIPTSHFHQQIRLRKPTAGKMPIKIGPFIVDSTVSQSRPQTGQLRSGRLKPLLGWQGQEKPVIDDCVGIISTKFVAPDSRQESQRWPPCHCLVESWNQLRPPPSSRATSPTDFQLSPLSLPFPCLRKKACCPQ
jgi:hypothetical protein